jgi:hypothetical protein
MMMIGHLLLPYSLPTQEGAPHSLLLDIESVNWFHNVPAHLPKVRPGGAVHRNAADTVRFFGALLR